MTQNLNSGTLHRYNQNVNCQVCSAPIEQHPRGRTKLTCSRKCRDAKAGSKRKAARQMDKTCVVCLVSYRTARKHSTYCSSTCRSKANIERSKRKWHEQFALKYPDRTRTVTCGWCGEDRTFEIGKSVVNAFHPKCTLEAQRARYRIKTVKRQKHKNPNRISHEQVVSQYGNVCHICQEPIDIKLPRTSRLGLTVDHVIPLSKGGTDTMDNLRPAHWICNNRKSNKPLEEVIA